MHESNLLPCIFICVDHLDEFRHYLLCPILWQLAREALNLGEAYFDVGHRLCLTDCDHNRLELFGYCRLLYHAIRKSTECVDSFGHLEDGQFVQSYAVALHR